MKEVCWDKNGKRRDMVEKVALHTDVSDVPMIAPGNKG